MKIRLPIRSAIYKHCTGGLVPRWVTTRESPLLYVFGKMFFLVRTAHVPISSYLATTPYHSLSFCVPTSPCTKKLPSNLLRVILLTNLLH